MQNMCLIRRAVAQSTTTGVVCHVNVAHTKHAPLGPVFNVQQSNVTAMMKLGQQIRQIMCIILLVCKYAMNAPTGIEHKQFDTQI